VSNAISVDRTGGTAMQNWPTLSRPSLPAVAAAAGAVLGLLVGFGGATLMLAVLWTEQPASQALTAVVLLTTGIVNWKASRGIRHTRGQSLLLSALVTVVFVGYSALVLRNFGETFWLHTAYLLLLGALQRQRMKRAPAAA